MRRRILWFLLRLLRCVTCFLQGDTPKDTGAAPDKERP